MSRALFNRMLLAIHGQGDELATPSKRHFVPGSWDHSGRAVRLTGYAHCTGGCHGGRRACDCTTGCVELGLAIGPDDKRVIQPPHPLPDDVRSRVMRRTYIVVAAMSSALAGLIALAGSETMR